MNGCKLSAVGEEQHKEKGKDIAHGGTPPFRNRVRVYMKKELHRHRENAGTALNFCILKRIIKLLPDLKNKHIFTESFIRNT